MRFDDKSDFLKGPVDISIAANSVRQYRHSLERKAKMKWLLFNASNTYDVLFSLATDRS